MAARADSKELQAMGHGLEAVLSGNSLLQFFGKAFFQLDDIRAAGADKVMVMSIVAFVQKFELCRASAEVESFDHFHLLEQMHGTVDGGKITVVEFLLNLLDAQGSGVASYDLKNRLPLACDLPQFASEPLGQLRQPRFAGMMVAGFHADAGWVFFDSLLAAIEAAKRTMLVRTITGPDGMST